MYENMLEINSHQTPAILAVNPIPEHAKPIILVDADNLKPDILLKSLPMIADSHSAIAGVELFGRFGTDKEKKRWRDALAVKQCNHTIHALDQLTPSGKNAADIKLVGRALELLFNEKHQNFVIISNDSDFVPLVEQMKQYKCFVSVVGLKYLNPKIYDLADRTLIHTDNHITMQTRQDYKRQQKHVKQVMLVMHKNIRIAWYQLGKPKRGIPLYEIGHESIISNEAAAIIGYRRGISGSLLRALAIIGYTFCETDDGLAITPASMFQFHY